MGNPSVFQKKFWYRKFSCIGEEGRGVTVLSKKVLSHRIETKKLGTGTLLFSIKFLVWKKLMDKRGSWYHVFPSKIVCLTMAKNLVGEPFLVSEKFWSRNFSCIRGVSRFSVVLIKLKSVGKGWDSNPYQPLLNPVVLSTVPWEQLEVLTNVSEIIKISDTAEIQTRTYHFRTLLS